jgi:2-keto-4-pentenoate hydratase/2-oxohepta-3-ene-1,7-dioic acid hydratase in catechol pathway
VQLVSTSDGIGRLEDDEVALLEVAEPDLSAHLWAHGSLERVAAARERRRLPLADATLLAPLPRPGKVWAIGLNYHSHAAETGREAPSEPMVFIKTTSSVVGHGAQVVLPAAAPSKVDFEGEVAVVVGRRATSVRAEDAWAHVVGLTACDDVTARDIQSGTGNFGLAKSFDTFTPLGTSLTTLDSYADPDDVGLETLVNGEVRQRARTTDLVHDVGAIIAYLSRFTTLEPGDVVSTGTPAGVGVVTGTFLRPGDEVEVRVEGVAPLVNRVAAAPGDR